MKPKLVIVGAGLAGCCLAHELCNDWDISFIELVSKPSIYLQSKIIDVGWPATTYPHIGSGLGGTTQFWHNGLIEISENVFDEEWPFPKSDLQEYYKKAYNFLSDTKYNVIVREAGVLRQRYLDFGISEDLLGESLVYPTSRLNLWKKINLDKRVTVIDGLATGVNWSGDKILSLIVQTNNNSINVEGDKFVFAAGGIGTPILLQKIQLKNDLSLFLTAGRMYQDHPTGFVGEVKLNRPFYKLWNFPITGCRLNMRIPLKVEKNGLVASFQLRPSLTRKIGDKVIRVRSILSEIQNFPFRIKNYLRLFKHLDDFIEILSFKFGINFRTKNYSVLMVADQPGEESLGIYADDHNGRIYRNWIIDDNYVEKINRLIEKLYSKLSTNIEHAIIYKDWKNNIMSSSHHSGTARMGVDKEDSVVDENCKVHGVENLYICDGSVIPSSGYANTGLTIAALSFRLSEHLNFLK